MKVSVLQVEDAYFPKWSWWSNWVDIATFNQGTEPYLIQMAINRRNKKKFRSVKISGKAWQLRQVSCGEIGDLTQSKKEGG
ncbi:hypothetical protein [Vibrio harveyi]|uniref:hypothetical protein n=1 Tax=Vibrio harveyi group TaxID=717610 RepID=UPI00238000AF|nr:hypothetical protein [Vibrio harveyi]